MVKTFSSDNKMVQINVGDEYKEFVAVDVVVEGSGTAVSINVNNDEAEKLGNSILAAAGKRPSQLTFADVAQRFAEASNLAEELGYKNAAEMIDGFALAGMIDERFLFVLRKLVAG